ncbi:hypothetical protein SLEP1_g53673 [Rubroshorea leprosula]|uniref:Uncharacterized protein n=1 Tax=Rubroshorea leprosula TaxID=152421 RepID=A0AAV5MA61_9ROSI|nr:hypothetical protein SLEP1_g53673 [Rubroshorea leprosula]
MATICFQKLYYRTSGLSYKLHLIHRYAPRALKPDVPDVLPKFWKCKLI